MGGLLILLAPEFIVISAVILAALVFLLLHIRSLAQNTFGAAALLLSWAMRAGFVGFIAYLAAWVFMFPVMAALCAAAGVVRTWLEFIAKREAKRQARAAARHS
jgi:hypothetical protein